MANPNLRADFNGLFGEVLCLSHGDSCIDASGAAVQLTTGMELPSMKTLTKRANETILLPQVSSNLRRIGCLATDQSGFSKSTRPACDTNLKSRRRRTNRWRRAAIAVSHEAFVNHSWRQLRRVLSFAQCCLCLWF